MRAWLLSALQDTFAKQAARAALVHEQRRFTFGDLTIRAREGAGWLQSLGVRKGDRVVLCTANKRAFVFGHLAALFAGAVSLPLNPRFTREELRFFLQDSGARVAIVGNEANAIIDSLRAELPALQHVVPDVAVLDAPKSTYRVVPVSADDTCLILYSSGTTGWPKGVVHTHGNVASSLHALQKCWRFTPDDVVLNVLPLFHIHGLCFATLLTLLTGFVILDEFEPQRTMERVKDCSVFMAVPTIYYRFLEQPNFREMAKTWTKTRLFTCGSAPIRAEVLPEIEAILGKPVINRYGMTEAFVITSLPLDGPWPNGSVGKALDGIEVRVANLGSPLPCTQGRGAGGEGFEIPRSGDALPQGDAHPLTPGPSPPEYMGRGEESHVGAVQIRGPNLFREYWNKPNETSAAFASGWFETGDLGVLDAAGFLTLVGRKNDLIITSGYNVYPQVVERVINDCPGVRESCVVGVPDERTGERVVAVVVRADPTLDEGRLSAFWTERLVDYQRPKGVVFVDALPRNAMGKVVRRELRDLIAKESS